MRFKMLRVSNRLINGFLNRRPPPVVKKIKKSDPAYLTVASTAGISGLGLTYIYEKYQPNKSNFTKWFGGKEKSTNLTEEFYNTWNKYNTHISLGFVCGLPIIFYLKNTAVGFNLTKELTISQNATGYIHKLNRIISRRGNYPNILNTSSEVLHRTFSHSGLIHLALNTYLAYTLIELKSSSRFDKWDFRQLSAAVFGGLFSSAIACRLGQLGLGFSGGVYAILGYFFASGGLDDAYFNIIFDVNGDYPFTLQDFGSKWIPIETVLAGLQVLKYQFSPIGHIAHVTGFFYGVMMYYIYQECHRPGYIQMTFRANQEKFIEKLNNYTNGIQK